MWDSSSGRQGPLCSRSYLTQANAASKTCHGTECKLCSHSSLPGATSPGPPVSVPPLPILRQSLGPIQLSSYLSPEVTAFCFLNLPHLAQPLERQASVTVTASQLSLRPANKKLPVVPYSFLQLTTLPARLPSLAPSTLCSPRLAGSLFTLSPSRRKPLISSSSSKPALLFKAWFQIMFSGAFPKGSSHKGTSL